MKFFAIPNLATVEAHQMTVAPWETRGVNRSEFSSRASFRKFCADRMTQHTFFSTHEGLDPARRVSKENPPALCYGLVVDYDGKVDRDAFKEALKENLPQKCWPVFVASTFSGGMRAVWAFPDPVKTDQPELHKEFLYRMGKELKLDKLAPGLDKESFNSSKYWEVGDDWEQLNDECLPADVVAATLFDAGTKVSVKTDVMMIPMEKVEEAIHERFPGRWKGDVKVGARGPLFWVDDGVDRDGCALAENGAICYSTRAEKTFMTWKDIFGRDFIREYERKAIEAATHGTYYDGKRYWKRTGSRWLDFTKEDMITNLKVMGISSRINQGETCSECDKILLTIMTQKRVEGVAPFMFTKDEIVDVRGCPFINIANKKVTSPASGPSNPGMYPWLHTFFENIWDAEESEFGLSASTHFMAWLQRFYRGGLENNPKSGHVLVIAGPPGRGKSLLSMFILREIMGGGTDASAFLLNNNHFNKELGESPVWNVDDGVSAVDLRDHRRFSEMIKKHTANPEVVYHPKFRDAVVLPWKGRIVVTCNADADSLNMVPNLEASVLDKIMLFRLSETYQPDFFDSYKMEAQIRKELPFFLRDLLDWTMPEAVIGDARFGVQPYHHSSLVAEAREASPSHRVTEVIEMWRKSYSETMENEELWEGTATELLASINQMPELSPLVRSTTPISLGKDLNKIQGSYEPYEGSRLSRGLRVHRLRLRQKK